MAGPCRIGVEVAFVVWAKKAFELESELRATSIPHSWFTFGTSHNLNCDQHSKRGWRDEKKSKNIFPKINIHERPLSVRPLVARK